MKKNQFHMSSPGKEGGSGKLLRRIESKDYNHEDKDLSVELTFNHRFQKRGSSKSFSTED